MASITIRNISDDLKKRLRKQAAENGRSMEAEAREILNKGIASQPTTTSTNLFDSIRKRFEPFGGVELENPQRTPSHALESGNVLQSGGMAEEKQPFRTSEKPVPKAGIAESIRRRFAPFGGVELEPFPDEVLEARDLSRKTRRK